LEQSLDGIEQGLDRLLIMEALTQSEAGINFLQWLVRICGFNKPSMCMEDAARRDVWLTIRTYVPLEKLAEIEHHDVLMNQRSLRQTIQAALQEEHSE
jgi:hypothetical protein